jgi:ribonuclease J
LEEIHVSGHACQEEHKMLHALLNPKFFIPVHGEYRHLKRHVQLATSLGMKEQNTLIPEIGSCVELTENSMSFGENIPAGTRLIDGEDVQEYGASQVMKERLKMSSEGVFVVSVAVTGDYVINDPVVESRGCVFANNETEVEMGAMVRKALKNYDFTKASKDDLSAYLHKYLKNYFYKTTKQAPLIIVSILDV